MKSKNFNIKPTVSKTLDDGARNKGGGTDGFFLWFATKCKCQPTYHQNVEVISFAIGKAVVAAS